MRRRDEEWLSAREATRLLGVKPATLYAYVSRSLVRSRPTPGERARRYSRSDVERLVARTRARKGHGAVAGGALLFGEPVLDTRISTIDARGPWYRGSSALALAEADTSPERIAELLWTGELPERAPPWPKPTHDHLAGLNVRALQNLSPVQSMLWVLAVQPAESDGPSELQRARGLVRLLAFVPGVLRSSATQWAAVNAPDLTASVLAALGQHQDEATRRAVARALVLSADHELNASTFAARIAAGAGSDLARCVSAALCVFSGVRHGGACDAIERYVSDLAYPEQALARVRHTLSGGSDVPGFGHPLYPEGDPRAPPLIELAAALNPTEPRVRALSVVREAVALAGGEPPTIDHALVVLTAALELPAGSASAMFAVGRSIGYIAHALEQRESGQLLRPRARYVGP